jgi:hypothetical protein
VKRSEWIEVLAVIRVDWPHAAATADAVAAKWFRDLEHLPGDQVKVAVEALYRDGREFPPNGAQILGKVVELSDPQAEIDHGEAWQFAKRASLMSDEKGVSWLRENCPAAAEAVQRLCGSSTLTFMVDDEPTVRAQFRDIYNNLLRARKRDALYAGLPSAGLRSLERGPKKIGDVLQRALAAPAGGIPPADLSLAKRRS